MSKYRITLLLAGLVTLALMLSACAGGIPASSWPGLSVSGDSVYVAYQQQVHSVNLDSGVARWSFPAPPDPSASFFASPVPSEEGLVVGSYDSKVRLLDAATGSPKWVSADLGDRIIGGALVAGGTAYVPSADSNLYALDLGSGNLRCSFEETRAGLWAGPVSDGGDRIYFGSMDHRIYALDAPTCEMRWTSPTELGGAIAGSPALGEGTLYVGSFDKKLQAVDADTGEINWRIDTLAWVWAGPLIADGTLYAGDLEGNVYAINAEDGSVRWKIQPEPDQAVRGTPALLGDVLYFGTRSGTLHAVSARDGAPLWSVNVGGQLLDSPAIAGDKVIVASLNAPALVYALNAESGAQIWSYQPARP